MAPCPALTLTIPSINDNIVLDCRIYSPPHLLTRLKSEGIEWRKKCAIVAHPYAPLGGSYDDPIVDIVASCLLEESFFVGTFNFRGAGASRGRTSWTAKPETDDYISFIGLMVYFMHYLSVPESFYSNLSHSWDAGEPYNLTPIPSHSLPPSQSPTCTRNLTHLTLTGASVSQSRPLVLLAGYSYGALVTTKLPTLSLIISLFDTPEPGSAASEIVLRAQQLAKRQNETFTRIAESLKEKSVNHASQNALKHSRGRSLQTQVALGSETADAVTSIRLGGEETDPDLRRVSHDLHNRRSLSLEPERLRKSIDKVRSFVRRPCPATSPQRHGSTSSSHGSSRGGSLSMEPVSPLEAETENGRRLRIGMDGTNLTNIKASYLLISPLQGIVTKLATMWSKTPRARTQDLAKEKVVRCDTEEKFVLNDTLAIFGDEDIFSTIKKLRLWADRLNSEENSRFQHVEIQGAGHFWHEEGVVDQMRVSIETFVSGL